MTKNQPETRIHNSKLRGTGETLMDAMRQGEAAQDEKSKTMISDALKRASRS